jgi:hypothetical protein
LFTDINGADTENPTDADEKVGKIIYQFIKVDSVLTLLIKDFP